MADFGASCFDIGIDLGTTNCLLAFKRKGSQDQASLLSMEQFDTHDALIKHMQLSSFLYLPQKHEQRKGVFELAWRRESRFVVGRLARSLQYQFPDRVITSAKSWLANKAVDRTTPMLPWQSVDVSVDDRMSPVDVSSSFLAYLADYWNATIAEGQSEFLFAKQNIVITVPASFDESAQVLTLEAAKKAGYPSERIQILEEPLAAFYYWLQSVSLVGNDHEVLQELKQKLADKPLTILVADIGGGTTDFSMFKLTSLQPLAVERIAVSDHLLLGGDNIDLALARMVELKMFGKEQRASNREFSQLIAQARQVKESFLGDSSRSDQVVQEGQAGACSPEEYSFSVTGEGSSLFDSLKTESLSRRDIERVLFEGFFPPCERGERPAMQQGLREFGLPYAKDIAITRHLAAFVRDSLVDAVLVNGGSLKSDLLQQRLLDQLSQWNGFKPLLLRNSAEDSAVALGASYFAGVSRQQMVISNYPRSVYLMIQGQGEQAGAGTSPASSSQSSFLCIIEKGLQRTESVTVDLENLRLRLGRPVALKVFTSHDLPEDKIGQVYAYEHFDQHKITFLPTFTNKFVLEGNKKHQRDLPVKLTGRISNAGLLELSIVSNDPDVDQSWDMSFDLSERVSEDTELTSLQTEAVAEVAAVFDQSGGVSGKTSASGRDLQQAVSEAVQLLNALYGKGKSTSVDVDPKSLVRRLEQTFAIPRQQWPASILRELWPALQQGMTRKGRSPAHEAAWFNVAGYSLRPGFGYPGDPWRIEELSEVVHLGMSFPKEHAVEDQWFIMWRRVAGGVGSGVQLQLYSKAYPRLLKEGQDTQELWRFVGALERLPIDEKVKLGHLVVKKLLSGKKSFLDQKLWVMMRLVSREPLHAGLDSVVPAEVVTRWLSDLMQEAHSYGRNEKMQKVLLYGARQTGMRDLDILPQFRRKVRDHLALHRVASEQLRAMDEVSPLSLSQREDLYGESLPAGITLSI